MMLNVPIKRNQSKQNLNQTTSIAMQENEFKKIICEMAAVFLGLNLLVKCAPKSEEKCSLSILTFSKIALCRSLGKVGYTTSYLEGWIWRLKVFGKCMFQQS